MTEDTSTRDDTSTTASASTGLSTADLAAPQSQSSSTAVAERDSSGDTGPQAETQPPRKTEAASSSTPLFAEDDASGFRSRWTDIQTSFVDEPRQAVEQADSLVAEVMQRLAQTFADERNNLEGQWQQGDDISTEDLRVALQRYRSFFDRLLSV